MNRIFHTKIRKALGDSNLQSALDGNATRRIAARQIAYDSLPENVQIMRQKANTIRKNVVENLDQYLEQFINHASKNGLIIHHADDAQKAVQIVLDIAQNSGAERIVKSKSMVSEEINLNSILEKHGIQVVETDLGEYIVQLRGEPPAHIITPAVHLTRKDVGELFSEKLGIPFTDDVSTLTSVARKKLRQTFLDADIGITGVNFGVAENGALCILTNEGNGRMVTTLPNIHIALMGIERLVPSMQDLALMIELLPRSATGQKITVYANLIFSPRHSGELDGSQVRHLILLDNGRSHLQTSILSEILYCIRCGACINACPIFREIGGHAYVSKNGQHTPYPGPVGSVLSPGLFGVSDFGQLARASSLCGACKEACPVDIDIPKLLLRVRAGGSQIEEQRIPVNVPSILALGLSVFTWAAVKTRLFNLAQRAAGTLSGFFFPRQRWLKMP
ncbi:MAG: LutB/LldF family L-lactate oxidation iron-sulfur protein, partial [Anaerolineales bacterium]